MDIKDLTSFELLKEIENGAKVVQFHYCISVLLITFTFHSKSFLIQPGEDTKDKSIKYTLLTLLLGWWGFPLGPIFTIKALLTNFKGGNDLTPGIQTTLNIIKTQSKGLFENGTTNQI